MIYLDTCILVYALEDTGPRGDIVRARIAARPDVTFAVSPLVTLELLVGPLRNDDLELRDHYVAFLAQFRRLPLTENEFFRAAELRARHNLRTPDALHLAAAQLSGCDELWTNDSRLAVASHGLAANVLTLER
ncbi:type II toxin-antitoxin system VapC family toxin [Mycetocola zhadangensis]|uniref:type II toxin-antitoxin system VapC family toxin n=1 Tax=Mycetocola zhadangensis TaxID=1164595 RepID=UPI001602EA74|nr:type II toxin-antitoxin system VapC family toxin [Mycetocola zhadangensis]